MLPSCSPHPNQGNTMTRAHFLVASVRIRQNGRDVGGIGHDWSLAWAVHAPGGDPPAWDEDNIKMPSAFRVWGIVWVAVEYDDDTARVVGHRAATPEEVADATRDAAGWERL